MERNGKTIPLFGSLSEGNGMEHTFLPIPSKPQIFIPLTLRLGGGKGMEWKKKNILRIFSHFLSLEV